MTFKGEIKQIMKNLVKMGQPTCTGCTGEYFAIGGNLPSQRFSKESDHQ